MLGSGAYIPPMADKPAPKADDSYSEEEADRRMDASVRAMIGMRPKPHQPLAPKRKTRPGSKSASLRRSSGSSS